MLTMTICFWFVVLYLLAAWVFGIGINSMWLGISNASRRRYRPVYKDAVKWPVILLCSVGWPVVACAIIWEYYFNDFNG